MVRPSLRALILAFGLVNAAPVLAQSVSEPVQDPASVLLERRAIDRVPPTQPSWRPPALPPGSTPVEEIGSLESRRDHEIDYPREARIARREGTTKVGFIIDETGRATDCVIVRSSGDVYLDTGSCALVVARGLYRPARDATGQALESGQTAEISWSLAWDQIRPLTERIMRLSYQLNADGRLSDCWADRGEGTPGVSHIEACQGIWPEGARASLHQIAGPGNLSIQMISGVALHPDTMERQIATPDGWVRYTGSAAWHQLDATGIAVDCKKVALPGGTAWGIDDPCRVTQQRFAVEPSEGGQSSPSRVGLSGLWYVKLPEG